MSRATTYPINSNKLQALLKSKGRIHNLSVEMGYGTNALGTAIRRGRITMSMAKALEIIYGIPFEDYKYEESKPEPKPEPVKETMFTNRSEQCLITLVTMVGEMRNNMIVLNEKLDKLIELWGED